MMRKLFTSALALVALSAMTQMVVADGIPVAGCCQENCLQKVCRPVVVTKTVVKPVYCCVCEDFCVPSCWSCNLFRRSCDDCGPTHSCSNVMTRKILVVKLCKQEKCVNRCEVDYVPACTHSAPCTAPCTAPCVAPCTTHGMIVDSPAFVTPSAPVRMPMPMPMPMPVAK